MLLLSKPYPPSSEQTRRLLHRSIKASLFTLLLLSLALPSYFLSHHTPNPTAKPPSQTPTTISHILFSIASSSPTFPLRQHFTHSWFRPNRTRAFVWLNHPPNQSLWSHLSPPWRVLPEQPNRFPNRASASRIARIATEAFALGLEGVRWFVMCDDDTVFFADNLVAVLGKYAHDEMYYVGAASESVEQDEAHSYGMGFGGGGFAVSYAAAEALADVMDGCVERYGFLYGSDQRVQACFSEIGVPLTREAGFHQVDLRNNIYGMLAAHPVAPLVSLHHLDYVQPISPLFSSQQEALKALFTASNTDPARTLQQTFCYIKNLNWSLSLSWAYTAQLYPWIVAPNRLEVPLRTFVTWRSFSSGPFSFNTRDLAPPSLPCERPFRFFLNGVTEERNGTVTEYERFGWGDESGNCNETGFRLADKVVRVRAFAPRMDPHVWVKAPRRQCCDVRQEDGESIEMQIRQCGPREATSPP